MENGKNRYMDSADYTPTIMNTAGARRIAAVAFGVLFLLGGNAAFADSSNGNTSQPLAFAVGSTTSPAGTVFNLGNQTYSASGGSVVIPLTSILGQPLTAATLNFSVEARVNGLNATGAVEFSLVGTSGGKPVTVTGSYGILNNETSTPTNALQIIGPSGTCTGRAAKACSELPLSFVGNTDVLIQIGNARPLNLKETVRIENPYFNPFGAPIIIASSDLSIVITTTYDVGMIDWSGAVVSGAVTNGTLGTGTSAIPVMGRLILNSTEKENLVAGTATDKGTVALVSMVPSSLDVSGRFSGSSVIPTAGEVDCSPSLGFPAFPAGQGVCTETGFNSIGHYLMKTSSGGDNGTGEAIVIGHYATTWTIPALAFSVSSTASVTNHTSSSG